MTTSYFLADSRFMTIEEILEARHFEDSALFCHRASGLRGDGGNRLYYRIEVPGRMFFNLPGDLVLINNNSDIGVNDVGDLRRQIIRNKGKIITPAEGLILDKKSHEEWLRTRPDTLEWKEFVFALEFEEDVFSQHPNYQENIFLVSNVMNYLKRCGYQ